MLSRHQILLSLDQIYYVRIEFSKLRSNLLSRDWSLLSRDRIYQVKIELAVSRLKFTNSRSNLLCRDGNLISRVGIFKVMIEFLMWWETLFSRDASVLDSTCLYYNALRWSFVLWNGYSPVLVIEKTAREKLQQEEDLKRKYRLCWTIVSCYCIL